MLLGSQPALGQDSRYRVEILVLSHLRHNEEAREVTMLEDLTYATDFLQPLDPESETESEAETATAELAPPQEPAEAAADLPAEGDSLEAEAEDLANAVIHVEEMGPEMQEAWRRLRLSAPFRPIQYLAWEQGSNEPFPALRVHDLEPVLVIDPWAEERLALAEADEVHVFGDTVPAEPAVEPAAETEEEEPALPDPIVYYQLDGTASLTRSRFLHLRLAIEWRQPVFDGISPQPAIAESPSGEEEPIEPVPSRFLVYRLEQSRPVRTGRMEYFDHPVLGVLAWVTEIEVTDTEVQTD